VRLPTCIILDYPISYEAIIKIEFNLTIFCPSSAIIYSIKGQISGKRLLDRSSIVDFRRPSIRQRRDSERKLGDRYEPRLVLTQRLFHLRSLPLVRKSEYKAGKLQGLCRSAPTGNIFMTMKAKRCRISARIWQD
jgi:hypothetical protein